MKRPRECVCEEVGAGWVLCEVRVKRGAGWRAVRIILEMARGMMPALVPSSPPIPSIV